jgi:hypothetical protein
MPADPKGTIPPGSIPPQGMPVAQFTAMVDEQQNVHLMFTAGPTRYEFVAPCAQARLMGVKIVEAADAAAKQIINPSAAKGLIT